MKIACLLLPALTVSTAASANVVAPAGAVARFNPAAPENRQVLPTFNFTTVESVLAQIGARYVRGGTATQPALAVTLPNGRQAGLVFGSCTANGAACRALSIQALWPRPTGPGLEAAVQRFNQRYAFSKAFVAADGRPVLQRYMTADYGVIRGDLAINLLVFGQQADRFANDVLRPLGGR